LEVHRNIPSSNGSGINVIGPKQALRIQIGHMKKWLKCPWSPLLLHCLLPPKPHYGLMGSSLQSVDRGRFWTGLPMVLDNMQTSPENGQLERYIPFFWDIPEGQW